MFRRIFSTARSNFKSKTVDDYLIQKAPKKVWEQRGITKDEFFMRKYGNITPEHRQKLTEKVERQRRMRQIRKDRDKEERRARQPSRAPVLNRNPLFEYIYGTHSVRSALLLSKRTLFNTLFVHNGDVAIINKAKSMGVRVVSTDKRELNRLTENGVHNGVVLETKSLLLPTAQSLGGTSSSEGTYEVSIFDEVCDSVTSSTFSISGTRCHPIGVLLDGITDPQNVGSIIRSAWFLGVDFVVIPATNSARLGPVAAKASAGAIDMIEIYDTSNPIHFVVTSKKAGWNIVTAASAISSDALIIPVEVADLLTLAAQGPLLLVLGSEGDGVRRNILNASDFIVSVPGGRVDDIMVDSLNVSVAAGILIAAATTR